MDDEGMAPPDVTTTDVTPADSTPTDVTSTDDTSTDDTTADLMSTEDITADVTSTEDTTADLTTADATTADVTNPAAVPVHLLRTPANRVSQRAVIYWFTRALFGWLIVIGAQIVAWIFNWPVPPWHPQVLAATVGIAILHLAVMPRWRFHVHRWELTAEAVYTRSGWLTQEWRIAPVSRIQTVDTERGPIGRLFHLTKVTVTTASAAGPLTIDGLDEPVAAQFALQVTAAAQATQGDAT